MPELPEVETIKRALEPHVVGLTISGVRVRDVRPLQNVPPDEFCVGLIGRKVLLVKRRGKYLIFGLSGGLNLIIHLRMTGALLWNPRRDKPFARIEFAFDDGSSMVFSDVRRFGTMNLVGEVEDVVGKLGYEPLTSEFTSGILASLLKPRSAPVKSVLLDQAIVTGIGNMYADEALFQARIHPLKPASLLNQKELIKLHDAIQDVLRRGIKNQGASIRNYRMPDGASGSAHEEFAVAHRQGKSCPCCGFPIARIVVGQRGTCFCPVCQAATFIK